MGGSGVTGLVGVTTLSPLVNEFLNVVDQRSVVPHERGFHAALKASWKECQIKGNGEGVSCAFRLSPDENSSKNLSCGD